MAFLKTRYSPKEFANELKKIVHHLTSNGIEKLFLAIPFSCSKMEVNDIKAWELYERILDSFKDMAKKHKNVQIIMFDSLVMKKTN